MKNYMSKRGKCSTILSSISKAIIPDLNALAMVLWVVILCGIYIWFLFEIVLCNECYSNTNLQFAAFFPEPDPEYIRYELLDIRCEKDMSILFFEPVRTRIDEVQTVKAPQEEQIKTESIKPRDDKEKTHIETDVSDELLLCWLVHAEAGTEDFDGLRLVCDVVLNRVRDPRFPNNVHDVIFQTGQFQVTNKCAVSRNYSTRVVEAVKMELYGNQLDNEVLYFGRKPITSVGVYRHGNHYFSK